MACRGSGFNSQQVHHWRLGRAANAAALNTVGPSWVRGFESPSLRQLETWQSGNAPASKTGDPKGPAGSNPAVSANAPAHGGTQVF